MKLIVGLALLLPLWSAEEAKPAAEAKETAPAPAKSAAEQWLTGNFELGYRWVQMSSGNFDVYRSVVNLGEGPKVLGADFRITDPEKRAFDRLTFSMHQWGGEPYSTLRGDAVKDGAYRVTGEYRSLAYFNNIPSFANPLLPRGVTWSQNSYDSRRRYSNVEVEFFPGRRFVPFFTYSRDWAKGRGVLPYFTEGNEYPIPVALKDRTDEYRGGVRIHFDKFHLTLEQGGIQFIDAQEAGYAEFNPGNNTASLFGRTQSLTKLNQIYDVTGSGVFSRVAGTASPFKWLNLFGQFLYSKPETKTGYVVGATGVFLQLNTLRYFTGQQDAVGARAKQPHPSGNIGFEVRPFRRLRVVESLMTDRLHNASSALIAEAVLFPGVTTAEQQVTFLPDRLIYNYNRQEVNAFFDVTSRVMLRGGFRYVWGDAQYSASRLNPFRTVEMGEINQKVGIAGLNVRWNPQISFNGEFEAASSDRMYFRTSLNDYKRMRARARYQVKPSILVGANFSLLDNQNPSPGLQFDLRQRSDSVSIQWAPKEGRRFSLLGDYTRSTLRSDLLYLNPAFLGPERSFYRENAHIATAMLDVNLFKVGSRQARVSGGGSLFVSSFSRATEYYQPVGRFTMPVNRMLEWFGEWRWYCYGESAYRYEAFRTNHIVLGFRFLM
jgi:hypothetical protein